MADRGRGVAVQQACTLSGRSGGVRMDGGGQRRAGPRVHEAAPRGGPGASPQPGREAGPSGEREATAWEVRVGDYGAVLQGVAWEGTEQDRPASGCANDLKEACSPWHRSSS